MVAIRTLRCLSVVLLSLAVAPALGAQAAWLMRSTGSPAWPTGIYGASACFDAGRQRVVLCDGTPLPNRGLWEWTGTAWVALPENQSPPARHYHAMASLWPAPGFLIHGGTPTSGVFGDLWQWKQGIWTQLAAGPSARLLHTMGFDVSRQVAVVFGGATDRALTSLVADTWEWDGTRWSQRAPAMSPPARFGHAMAFDVVRRRMVVFGGATATAMLGDTWEYDGTSWTQRTPVLSPSARAFGAMTFDFSRARVVLIGGRRSMQSGTVDEAWEWDPPANTWRQIPPQVSGPGPRDLLTAAYDFARQRTVVVGGYRIPGGGLSDTWEMLSASAASASSYGSGCAGTQGVPQLDAVGLPRLGNAAFGLRTTSARAQAPAALALAPSSASYALPGGCFLLVDPIVAMGYGVTDTAGAVFWPLGIPSATNWLGIDLYLQALVLDPMGAFAGAIAFTPGSRLVLGN